VRNSVAVLIAAVLCTPAAAQGSRRPAEPARTQQDSLTKCDAQATAKGLLGYTRGLFISDCLDANPAATPAPAPARGTKKAPAPQTAKPAAAVAKPGKPRKRAPPKPAAPVEPDPDSEEPPE